MHITAVSSGEPLRQNTRTAPHRTPSAPAATDDRVSLSLHALSAPLHVSMGLRPDQPITLDNLREVIRRDTAEVQKQLGFICHELGIDSSEGITLTTAFDGSIVVRGDVPHKEELEERLNNDPDFARPFQRLAANSCFVKAAEESLEFQQAYAVDPEKAVEEFMHLLDGNRRYHFSLTFADGTMTTEVTATSLPRAGRG